MAEFRPDQAAFASLKDNVVVVSGASTGIGAATVKYLHGNGAKVVFGDVNVEAGSALIKAHDGLKFVHCDVSEYSDIYNLFRVAQDQYGRVDHAISCAGVFEQGNWFDPSLTIDSVQREGNYRTMDVNTKGTMCFSRIAAVFLREAQKQDRRNRSIVLLSSVNAFRESPGLFLYQTSKHAIQGLLRSSRKTLWERDGVRINAVCPGVTDTPMVRAVAAKFRKAGLYVQEPEDVARMILGLLVREDFVGKAVYIEGGDGWEFEDGFYREQPRWLGEEPTRRMRINAEAVQKGALVPDPE